jgi:putative pyruvate formate lyase activating enzyme
MIVPSYIKLHESGRLSERVEQSLELLSPCRLCPRECGIDRLEGEKGFCSTGRRAKVASFNPHFGEEDPLVGRNGSGTIFISSCNLLCSFCQNNEISHGKEGMEVDAGQLASMMMALSRSGCHNINFVTPSHAVPQILEGLLQAIPQGLNVPLVYNSSGYDRVETLELLESIFDIYMPDLKFWDPRWSARFCGAADYPEVAARAVLEMHRQVGDLVLDEQGVAERGLLVRHLVMPGRIAGTEQIMEFLAHEISPDTYVNVMDQYRPCGAALDDELIGRRLTGEEFREALGWARKAGLNRLDSRRRERILFRL